MLFVYSRDRKCRSLAIVNPTLQNSLKNDHKSANLFLKKLVVRLLISLSKALFTVFEAIAFLLVQKGAGFILCNHGLGLLVNIWLLVPMHRNSFISACHKGNGSVGGFYICVKLRDCE